MCTAKNWISSPVIGRWADALILPEARFLPCRAGIVPRCAQHLLLAHVPEHDRVEELRGLIQALAASRGGSASQEIFQIDVGAMT